MEPEIQYISDEADRTQQEAGEAPKSNIGDFVKAVNTLSMLNYSDPVKSQPAAAKPNGYEGLPEEFDIELLMHRIECSRDDAIDALMENENDIIATLTQLGHPPGSSGSTYFDNCKLDFMDEEDIPTNSSVQYTTTRSDEDIKLVMSHAGCTRKDAIKALAKNDDAIVPAIMDAPRSQGWNVRCLHHSW
ncbi:hypothetical protein BJ508DRAFT_333967 [Ascobolus immersus RN42]|uniref:Nascent polypeptide-associated complex subunit alpha-like UBA domain-containing protein n=1 Tax=Ascobolus immersus RN42 TaxID=1160509 RepID=A0A3N4HN95_ASCIM|nr:hypothetical protein BJ508DRAFT_333967 [Ascobolus immersus RN42]